MSITGIAKMAIEISVSNKYWIFGYASSNKGGPKKSCIMINPEDILREFPRFSENFPQILDTKKLYFPNFSMNGRFLTLFGEVWDTQLLFWSFFGNTEYESSTNVESTHNSKASIVNSDKLW